MINKNIIVTGGAGFIGSNVSKILFQNNFNPIVIDDLSSGYKKLVKYGKFIKADFGDYKKMERVFKKYQPIAIIHIAGYKSVAESIVNPFKYYDNNVSKTNILLKAMVNCGIKNFIFSSSAAIFGIPQNTENIDEQHPANPTNPYGESKLMVEKMLESYKNSHNLKYSALRYFNVVGGDPDLQIGEIFINPSNIFPAIIQTIDRKRDEFVIFGDDYETKDGSCIRDYIHVWDLANAHLKALEKQLETSNSIKINLGNGIGFSVKEVIDAFKRITNVDFKVTAGKRRAGDASCVIANNKLANDYLEWKPKYTKLEDQIKHAWGWHIKSATNDY
jgi:UDP-glucose 4-epimerase